MGASQTLQEMARLIRQGKREQEIRNLAVKLTTQGFNERRGLLQKDYEGEARRLLQFVRDEIRYVRDTNNVELLHDPLTLLDVGAGDCDDKAILLASLLESIGNPTRLVAVAFEPEQFSHVWVQAFIHGRWIDLEATEPLPYGQSVPTRGVVETLVQPVT